MIEIRQLRYFQAVAQELHFSRAAARLFIAQPALSRQIRQLEETIGTPLFFRTQRRVELTAAGVLFLERTNRLLEEVDRAARDAQRVGSGKAGHLTLGFIHSSTYGLLPQIIGRFHQLYPDIELDLRELSINAQILALTRGTIDIGLLRPQPMPQTIEMLPIMKDHFLLAVPRKHRFASRNSIHLRELNHESVIMFSKPSSPLFHARITAMCQEAEITLEVAQHATQIHTIVGLVGAGIGIAIVPGIARNLRSRNVSYPSILDDIQPVDVALAWSKGKRTPTAQSFCDVALATSRTLTRQRI